MKTRCVLSLLFLLTGLLLADAQVSVVKGKLYVFNSKFETGHVQFVEGATTEDFYHRGNQFVTKSGGYFHLELVGIQDNEKVQLKITKTGWGVINTDLLFPVTGEHDTIAIYMIPNGKLDESKIKYYHIGTTAGEQELKVRLAQSQAMLKDLSSRNDASQDEILALKKQIDELNEDKKNLSRNSIELSVTFANMNLDIANQRSINAFNLFNKGKVKEALDLLNIDTLEKEADKFKAGIKKGDEIIRAGMEIKNNNERGLQQIVGNYMIGATLNINQFNFPAADEYFRLAIEADSLNGSNLGQYGSFLIQQKHYAEAIRIYEQLFKVATDPAQQVLARTNLGNLYHLSNSAVAFTQYNKALRLSEQLSDSLKWNAQSVIYNGLGGSYFDLTDKKDSVEQCYLKALAIKRKILSKDSTAITYFEYLKTASNLIAVYADTYSCQQGEQYAQIALPGLKKLSDNNFNDYGDYFGKALMNYSVNFRHCDSLDRAVTVEKQAIEVYENLVKKNSEAFLPILASSYHNLAALYDDLHDYKDALEYTRRAVQIRQKYFDLYPDIYSEVLCESTINMCRAYYYGYIDGNASNKAFYIQDGLKRLRVCVTYLNKYNTDRNKQIRLDEANRLIQQITAAQ